MITIHSYAPTTWVNGTTQGSGGVSGTMTNIESGISNAAADLLAHQQAGTLDHPNGSVGSAHLAAGAANDAAIGNRTPDDTQTPASGGAALTQVLSMLAAELRLITGNSKWYNSPPITLTSLNAHKSRHASGGADVLAPSDIGAPAISGDTFTGVVEVDRALSGANKNFLIVNATDGKKYGIVITTGGGLRISNLTDNAICAEFGPTAGAITANGNTVWTSFNDGSGSGLDADKLDGLDSTAFAQVSPTGQKITTAHALPSSGMAKWDVCVLTPFS